MGEAMQYTEDAAFELRFHTAADLITRLYNVP